jgi:hypothetical protein
LESPVEPLGTGFFVAPRLILTCAHVIKSVVDDPVRIKAQSCWESDKEPYGIHRIVDFLPNPYPDLALLQSESKGHLCACLDLDDHANKPFDRYFIWAAYTDEHRWGEGTTAECDLPAFLEPDKWFIKFKRGQVWRGFSGAPMLNKRTGRVSGIVKSRRILSDQGSRAVPVEEILSALPKLRDLQREFHRDNTHWIDAYPSETERGLPFVAEETLPRICQFGPLYDRRDTLDKALTFLAREDNLGLWITGPDGSGKTHWVTALLWQCLKGSESLFDDCVYYLRSPSGKGGHTANDCNGFIYKKLAEKSIKA